MTGPKRVTESQLAANRANALRSTGPRTPEGRAVVRYNALKHGILSQAVIPEAMAPYESREEFEELHGTLRDEFAPANSMEELLVEQIATAFWRLARLYRAEAGAIAAGLDAVMDHRWQHDAFNALRGTVHTRPVGIDAVIAELELNLNNKRKLRSLMVVQNPGLRHGSDEQIRENAEGHIAALRAHQQQDEQHRNAVRRAQRSVPQVEIALTFARYETALQNQLDRALSRLERLQRQRGGEFVTPPLQVNVTGVSGTEDEA